MLRDRLRLGSEPIAGEAILEKGEELLHVTDVGVVGVLARPPVDRPPDGLLDERYPNVHVR